MGDLLKEAIADAKAVRETALANAKVALEEAFTPQLKSMLSAKLKEDEFEDDEEEFGDEEEFDDEGGGEEDFGGEEEVPAEEPDIEGGDENPFAGGDEEEEFGDEEEDEVEENIIELNGQAFRLVPIQEDEVYEDTKSEFDNLDLESVIKELEDELNEEEEDIEESDNPYDNDEQHQDYKKVNEEGGKSGSGKDDPAGSGEELKEDDEYEIDESLFTEDDDELDEGEDDELDEEVDESSKIGSGTGRGNTDKSSAIGGSGQEKSQKMESVQAELKEYKEAVSFLKDKLHEVNILNAKLLFTNKLFKEFALDNNQKLKVVETFDRAQSTREIKLVYSTLAEQFGDNGSITKKHSIKESASKKSGSTKPSKESRKVITEEDQVAARFKKLANIL